MALAWFVCPYRHVNDPAAPTRYPAIMDYDDAITADGGAWSETEVLGGYALVKVRASDSTLTTIAGAPGFTRIPRAWRLDDPLSTLTSPQRTALKAKLNALGYGDGEIIGALGGLSLANVTLGQVLRFAASRRLKPRYDAAQQQIVLDGAYQACTPVAVVDAAVTE